MSLAAIIKKLRAAADSLEDLLYEGTSTKKLAKRLVGDLPLREMPLKRKHTKRRKKAHWTQRPENAKAVRRWKARMRMGALKKAGSRGE